MAERLIKFLFFIGLLFVASRIVGWLILGLVLGASLAVFLFIYFVLAPNNIFFTIMGEGTAKVVVRGARKGEIAIKGAGEFRKALIQWRDWKLDKDSLDLKPLEKGEKPRRRILGGLRPYGLWPLDRIYKYKFEWTGLKQDGQILYHPPEILDYILLKQDVYFAKVEKAEDSRLLPLDIGFILTISITNPYKALFAVQNWLEAVINRTIPIIRTRVTEEPYEKLIQDIDKISAELHGKLGGDKKEDRDKGLYGEFEEKYGVKVHKTEVQKIDPPDVYREATLKDYLGEQEKKKTIREGEAEGERRKRVADGEKYAIDRISAAQAKRFEEFKKVDPQLGALALDTAGKITPNKIILIGKDLGDAVRNLGNLFWYPKKPGTHPDS